MLAQRDVMGSELSLKQIVKNTFIEFVGDDEDPWMVNPNTCRRQQTDSFLDRRRSSRLVHFEEDEKSTDEGSNHGASSSQEEEGRESSIPSVVVQASSISSLEAAYYDACKEAAMLSSPIPQQPCIPVPETAWGYQTTVMLRNIPCKYTQAKLMREINSTGFLGRFDFLYVPMDPRSKANRGFAFCNFDSPDVAKKFFDMYNGKKLRHFSSDKVIEIAPADIQGFEANAEHYMSTKSAGRVRNSGKPLFMRPLPPHLLGEEDTVPPPSMMPGLGMPTAPGMPGLGMPGFGMPGFGMQDWGMNLGMPAGISHMEVQRSQSSGSAEPPRFCPYCGKERQNTFRFCAYCGKEQPACP